MEDSDTSALLGEPKPKTLGQRLRAMATPQVLTMAIYTVCYVTAGVVNSIYLKKLMNNLNNYPFFLNQVTNYGYIPIFGIAVLYELKFTKLITKEQRDFPWWKFFTMGLLDAINGYIVVIGGVGTSGTMQQLLNQAIIPVTMIGSFIFLKERYSLIQIGGSLLIVGGVTLSLLPSLTNNSSNSGNITFFNLFFLCQAIPFAASNLYKDIAFKSVDMDVWYLQFWDVFYQSVIGTFLFPVNTILPKPANIAWKQIPSAMKNGAICLSGVNVITTNCGFSESDPCDNCHNAWLTLLIYMTINVIYNIFILLVIKHGSAAVLSLAQTVRLPLTSIAFSQEWIMGKKQKEPFSQYSLYGLFIILAGLITFRSGSLLKRAQEGGDTEGSVRIIPRLGPGGTEIFSEAVHSTPLILPKTTLQHRQQYFSRLGIVQ